ncbi:MAG: hypothetical protein NVS9B3_15660 [Gemmatimonadaceae bacterium]
MNHRHLLPDEIDQLVDGEAGFGVAPLRAHLEDCPACREQTADARALVELLEGLPRLAPSTRLADRVMASVNVFEPWHVAARDTIRRLTPRSTAARIVAAAGAVVAGSVTTGAAVWLLARGDVVAFLVDAASESATEAVANGWGAAAGALVGPTAATVLQSGGVPVVVMVGAALVGTVTGSALWLRRLATASARRRG